MTRSAWKDDFPIARADEDFVTRREFARSLVGVSCAALAANAALLAVSVRRHDAVHAAKAIARIDEIPVGAARVFHYPDETEPCVLVRRGEQEFVAFAQRCTHLGCPVLYDGPAGHLQCPCHEGAFDAATGAVLFGPPPRPLPTITLERRGDVLWAVGRRA
jgi:Rieske Fe-S protein